MSDSDNSSSYIDLIKNNPEYDHSQKERIIAIYYRAFITARYDTDIKYIICEYLNVELYIIINDLKYYYYNYDFIISYLYDAIFNIRSTSTSILCITNNHKIDDRKRYRNIKHAKRIMKKIYDTVIMLINSKKNIRENIDKCAKMIVFTVDTLTHVHTTFEKIVAYIITNYYIIKLDDSFINKKIKKKTKILQKVIEYYADNSGHHDHDNLLLSDKLDIVLIWFFIKHNISMNNYNYYHVQIHPIIVIERKHKKDIDAYFVGIRICMTISKCDKDFESDDCERVIDDSFYYECSSYINRLKVRSYKDFKCMTTKIPNKIVRNNINTVPIFFMTFAIERNSDS